MDVFKTVQELVSSKLRISERKKQVRKHYVKIGHNVLVNFVIPNLNSFVRHLVKEKGLDPDYKPSSVLTYEPTLTQEQIKEKLIKFFTHMNNTQVNYTESWTKDSFKDISKHPVYKSRLLFEGKQKSPEPLPIIIKEPLQVSIDDDAISQIRTAIKNIEETVSLPEKVVEKPKKRIHRKKPVEVKSVVTKSFNGNFRRVDNK